MLPRDLFNPEHDQARVSVRRFLETEIMPFHEQWERDGMLPKAVWRKAGEAGLLCCDIPEAYGGPGLDFLYNVVVVEEIARSGATGAQGFFLASDYVAPYIEQNGTQAQKQRWLPRFVTAETIGAIAMSEPDTGSDLAAIRTSARRDGDGYVINGQKTWISNGQIADLFILAVKTDPGAGARGISLFLVEADTPGFRRGRKLNKVGLRAQDTSELYFDDMRVPAACMLGTENGGFPILMQKLARERLVQAVRSATVCETVLEWTTAYALDRRAFGKRLAEFQNTQFVLAELTAKVMAGRALTDRCIALMMAGRLDAVAAAAAKLHLTELHVETVDRCLQIFGGTGYVLETPIARAYLDARVVKITGGTSEIMKLLIARKILGL
jgi:alkylation response protein AidB-like acyl-CoA dehydrogenase